MRAADLTDRRLSRTQIVRIAARRLGPVRSRPPVRELADAVGLEVHVVDGLPVEAFVASKTLVCRPGDGATMARRIAHGVACVVLLEHGRPFAAGDVAALANLLVLP